MSKLPQQNKKNLKGTIEINLAGRRLGKKDLPGKSGKFDSAAEAAEFLENEQVKPKRRKR
jgi:hypothetical protein